MPFGPYAPDAHFDTGLGDARLARVVDPPRRRARGVSPTTSRCSARRRRSAQARSCAPACTRPPASSTNCASTARAAAHGPSFSYPDEQYYETTDVTSLVQAGRPERVRVRHALVDRGQGRPAVAGGFIAHITIDHADGHAPGASRPTRRGARTPGRGSRARRATTKATSSSTSTNGSIPSVGTGPASTTALAAADGARAASVDAVHASRRGAHPHRRARACAPVDVRAARRRRVRRRLRHGHRGDPGRRRSRTASRAGR